ncbi:MAG: biotin--[acetyl-CoA-carboxylase] ligase [Thermodesulfobacteriota bacterium]
MNINKIKENLRTKILGMELIYNESVESTNKLLFKLAEKGLEDGTVLISDEQTGGKGRSGRSWYSPGGVNLYLSVLLHPEVSPQNSAVFTFIASLALVKTLDDLNINSQIKWPNDLLINTKKVAGVLTEMKNEGNNLNFIIIGIGLNINLSIESIKENLADISNSVTSLSIERKSFLDREEVAVNLIGYLDDYYLQFKSEGINSIVAEWSNRWGKLNEKISVKVDNKIISGIVRKVDNYGFLYIEDDKGNLEKIIAGDIQS